MAKKHIPSPDKTPAARSGRPDPSNVIIKAAADIFIPIALVFGFYVILHGNISPGGGFQGGVLVAVCAILLYLGYGYDDTIKVLRMDVLKKNEAGAAIIYVGLAIIGILAGFNFCRNIFAQTGQIGDLFSAGTIALMNYTVGYKVLTGVAFLLLMLLGLLAPDSKEEEDLSDVTQEVR